MKKIRAAVVGYGNIGKFTIEALEAASDFEIAGVVRRNGDANKPAELAPYKVVKDIKELENVDVAILATPTRSVEQYAKEILALGILHWVSIQLTVSTYTHKSHLCAAHWAKQQKHTTQFQSSLQDGTREATL